MMIFVALVFLLVVLVAFQLLRQRYTKEGVPIIGNIPWLGCGWQFRKYRGYFIRDLRKKYGDVFQIYAAGRSLYFVFNDQFYHQFYNSPESKFSFHEGVRDNNEEFHFDILVGKKPGTESEIREMCILKPARTFLIDYGSTFTETFLNPHFNHFFNTIKRLQNIQPEEKDFKLDIAAMGLFMAASFGGAAMAGFEVADNPRFLEQMNKFMRNAVKAVSTPYAFSKAYRNRVDEARASVRELVDQAYAVRKLTPLADYVANATFPSTGEKYGASRVSFAVFSFLVATIANTNAAIPDCLLDIVTRPEIKKRVLEELEEVIVKDERNKDVKDGNYYFDQGMVNRLEYLQCCLTETLRLCSPPVHFRQVKIDLLKDDGSVLVPKNSYVCTCPWLWHRDESVFDDPEEYIPSRFAKDAKQKKRVNFLTFGHGLYMCVGRHFAETVSKLTLAGLLLRYDIQMQEGESTDGRDNKFIFLKPPKPIYCQFVSKY